MIDKIIERLEAEYIPEIEDEYDVGRNRGIDKAIQIVKQVAAEGDWIKCSDRLPTSDGKFEVTVKSKRGKRHVEMVNYRSLATCNKWDNFNVIAWRSRPEPFKESD